MATYDVRCPACDQLHTLQESDLGQNLACGACSTPFKYDEPLKKMKAEAKRAKKASQIKHKQAVLEAKKKAAEAKKAQSEAEALRKKLAAAEQEREQEIESTTGKDRIDAKLANGHSFRTASQFIKECTRGKHRNKAYFVILIVVVASLFALWVSDLPTGAEYPRNKEPLAQLSPELQNYAKQIRDFSARELTTPHAKQIWNLLLELKNDGFVTGNYRPLSDDLHSLNIATAGMVKLFHPMRSPFEIAWRLQRETNKPGENKKGFLLIQSDHGGFGSAMLSKAQEEWFRMMRRLPNATYVESDDLITNTAWLRNLDLEAGNGNIPHGNSATKHRRWSGSMPDYFRQYHLEIEKRIGDYLFTAELRDTPTDESNGGPWCRFILWFAYLGDNGQG